MRSLTPTLTVLLFAAGCLGAAAGCHSDAAATQPAAGPASAGGTNASATQSATFTKADLNPAMSDKQKDIILRHKNRD